MPGQFVYRNKETGATAEFDHEPTEQELDTHFAGSTQSGTPATSPVSPQAPGLLQQFLTKVGAPMAGFAVGGLAGGPPGAALGATAGKAYGDLYNMGTTGEIPDPLDETMGLAEEGVGAFAGAHVAPLLQKLPGPVALKNIGIGVGTGAGLGYATGHPGTGAVIGGALGAYNVAAPVARGIGRLSEFLTTPLERGAVSAEMSPTAKTIMERAVASGMSPNDPALLKMVEKANLNAGISPTPSTSSTPTFDAMGRSAVDRIKGLFERVPPSQGPQGPAAEQNMRTNPQTGQTWAGDAPQRRSTEVPYSANDAQMPNVVKGRPSAFERQQTVPRAESADPNFNGGVGEPTFAGSTTSRFGARPDLSNNPEFSHAAEVGVAGDWKPQNLTKTSPTDPEFDWSNYTGTTNPKRVGTGGASYSVEAPTPPTSPKKVKMSSTPDAAMKGLEQATGPVDVSAPPSQGRRPQVPPDWEPPYGPNTVGAAQKKGVRVPSANDPAVREYPPGIDKTNADASTWIPEWNDFYNEAMGENGVKRVRSAISALLNRKPGG